VVDQVTGGPKAEAATALGATYHHDPVADVAARLQPDVVIEATGAGSVVFDVIGNTGTYGITCLTGVSTPGRRISVDAGAENRQIVLDNDVVVGSVNANLRHYRTAVDALAKADLNWLRQLITRRVPLDRFADALTARPDDIKVVLTLTDEDR
jgi:threonine dehydrogenase-like Zn-dependent dehydrogenase